MNWLLPRIRLAEAHHKDKLYYWLLAIDVWTFGRRCLVIDILLFFVSLINIYIKNEIFRF